MSNGLVWKMSDLPPHMRAQVARQLGQSPTAKAGDGQKRVPHAAKALPNRVQRARSSTKMSHTEERFVGRFCPSRSWTVLRFEPFSIWVSGGFRYTPDFLVQTGNGELLIVETKGSWRLQSHSRARIAFADASTRTPGFVFCWAKENKKHNDFSLEFWRCGKILRKEETDQLFGAESNVST